MLSTTTAASVGELVASRSADPGTLAEAVAAAARQSRYAHQLPWRPAGLAMGNAGIAVLCAEMDRRSPGQGWDRAGHHHLSAATAAAGRHDLSLFSGLSGVGFAAHLLAGDRPRYRRLLGTIDETVVAGATRAADRLATMRGCAAHDHDLITGLTGIGVYLLTRGSPETPAVLSALAALLADTGHPRRWHTPAALTMGALAEVYPGGNHNCGLAHGVPGPLALLSLALIEGVEVPQSRAAIEAAARWLADNQCGTAEAPDWPDAVPLDGPVRCAGHDRPGRAAWCYGAPGVARSLWLAGNALDRREWTNLAARTIRSIATRDPEDWMLTTASFCHGRAGLLQVLRRFPADPVVAATAETLAADLAGEYDPDAVLGIRSTEPEGVLVDHPGLLDGAPGVALALLGPDPAGAPVGWDRMFLLS